MVEITPAIAKYLGYIAQGRTPKDALESTLLDLHIEKYEKFKVNEYPERAEKIDRVMQHEEYSLPLHIFDFMNQDVPLKIRAGAYNLRCWFINFDAFTNAEIEEIKRYLEKMEAYFSI